MATIHRERPGERPSTPRPFAPYNRAASAKLDELLQLIERDSTPRLRTYLWRKHKQYLEYRYVPRGPEVRG
jgi:hypothetical protein